MNEDDIKSQEEESSEVSNDLILLCEEETELNKDSHLIPAVNIDLEKYGMRSDTALIKIIIECFKYMFFFVQGNDNAYVWNGKKFEDSSAVSYDNLKSGIPITTWASVQDKIANTLLYAAKQVDKMKPQQGPKVKIDYQDWIFNALCGVEKPDRIYNRIRKMTKVKESYLNPNPLLVAMPNGYTIDFEPVRNKPDGQPIIRESSADDRNICNIGWEIDLTANKNPFEADLNLWFDGNKEAIERVKSICGYSLLGLQDEQAFFIHKGPGGDGKSQFWQIMLAAFGDYGVKVSPTFFVKHDTEDPNRHTTHYSELIGKRLVVCNEPAQQQMDMKHWVGDRVIQKYRLAHVREIGEFFQDQTIHFFTNHPLDTLDIDDGTWDRIRIILWPKKIRYTENDVKAYAAQVIKNDEYMKGVVLWLYEAALEYMQRGRLAQEPKEWSNTKSQQLQLADTLETFLINTTSYKGTLYELDGNTRGDIIHSRTKQPTLRKAYVEYCKQQNEKPLDKQIFNSQLKDKGLELDTRSYWQNLAVLDYNGGGYWIVSNSRGHETNLGSQLVDCVRDDEPKDEPKDEPEDEPKPKKANGWDNVEACKGPILSQLDNINKNLDELELIDELGDFDEL